MTEHGNTVMLRSEEIRETLADEILNRALKAGQELDEQELAERFGVSRTPVREALLQLSVSGLVEVRARRGAIVCGITPEDALNMFEMTAEFEALCVRLATYRMTPLERCHLQRLHDESANLSKSGYGNYDVYNIAWHEAIYNATHNKYMIKCAMELRQKMGAFRRIQLLGKGRMESSREEHSHIMFEMARGDGEEAARLMRAHLMHGASTLEQYLNERL